MYQPSLFIDQDTRLRPPRSLWKLAKRGIFIGTSGYSYDDWVGPYYPLGTKRPQMLDFHQQFYPAIELNYTYYSMPRPSTLFQIRNKAPHARFSVKAHQSITHERRAIREDWRMFADSLQVFSDTGQLAAVLFQFPSSFRCTPENFVYLDTLCEYFEALPIVFELRHAGWHTESTVEYARHRRIALSSVDAPHLPGLTSNVLYPSRRIAYYRLHGRNAFNWFEGDNTTRYDYTYTEQEIEEIVRNILALAQYSEHVYVFGNNHPRAQAIDTTIAIADALESTPALAAL
ncbi:MAG: DUF72 domain-containing protein [Ignavibacteriae bacterium]|nr:DUF72 domain-containing protein [Ignavibacteriota bacterium]